jgi:hypothetical protein
MGVFGLLTFFLLDSHVENITIYNVYRCQFGLIGKPVQSRHGPAAVTGNEPRDRPLPPASRGEGAGCRVIRESEDLPVSRATEPRGPG